MALRRYLAVIGLAGALGTAAPLAHAAPMSQQPVVPAGPQAAGAAVSPALEAALLQGLQQVFPAELFQQVRPRFLPLQNNLYLVSHPALFGRVEQEPAAKALAARLASLSPGWGTTLSNGPQGYGVYLTYRPNR